MNYSVDVPEMNKQRRNYIKNHCNYIEMNLLVGTEDNNDLFNSPVIPSVTVERKNVGSKEIAYMYATLKALTKDWEERYPFACLFANKYLDVENMGKCYYDETSSKNDAEED